MKGVIPTPDIDNIFHPTSDIRHSGKKIHNTNTQNSPRHSTPTFQKTEESPSDQNEIHTFILF